MVLDCCAPLVALALGDRLCREVGRGDRELLVVLLGEEELFDVDASYETFERAVSLVVFSAIGVSLGIPSMKETSTGASCEDRTLKVYTKPLNGARNGKILTFRRKRFEALA